MFSLESAVAFWRGQLENNRTFRQDDIDELERHIRDQVEELVSGGMSVKMHSTGLF